MEEAVMIMTTMAQPASVLKTYYRLTKPGIVYGNAVPAAGAFLLASRGHPNLSLFAAMLVGLCLVIASACVFNNYLDRHIDARMARTQKRPLPLGAISIRNALIYGSVLGIAGFAILAVFTTWLAFLSALAGHVLYVAAYGYAKRRTPLGTEVGAIAGAAPPVVGYTAVTGHFDTAALLLFLILAFWQMPHFYAIAIYRLKDYKAAGLPVLPAVKSLRTTKIRLVLYMFAFVYASVALTTFRYTGFVYLLIVAIVDAIWLNLAFQGFKAPDDHKWARSLFRFSLIVLTTLSVMMSIDILS
ncbi:MAG TPA: heme o synthase [Candidatus Saccharimonadia bacterium]|jgi:protoheme IX farnesyltransferase